MRNHPNAKIVMRHQTISTDNISRGHVLAVNGQRVVVNEVKTHEVTHKPYYDTDLGYFIPHTDTVQVEFYESIEPVIGTNLTDFFTDARILAKQQAVKTGNTIHVVSYNGLQFTIMSTDTTVDIWRKYISAKENEKENGDDLSILESDDI